MAFFSRKQKKIACNWSAEDLKYAYHDTENQLRSAAIRGNEKHLKKAMQQHGDIEYAMLYKQTPEYQKKASKKRYRERNRYE